MDEPTEHFETHITVQPTSDLPALKAWARPRGLKFTHIVLARGTTESQPMLTFHDSGSLHDQIQNANRLVRELGNAGFNVNRTKIEVGLEHPLVPVSEDQAQIAGDDLYFEFHVKLLLDNDSSLDELARLALRHNAHLSRNAFQVRKDRYQERFVTQRCYHISKTQALIKFHQLESELLQSNRTVLEIEKEYVVFDNNLSVDRGWIHEEESER